MSVTSQSERTMEEGETVEETETVEEGETVEGETFEGTTMGEETLDGDTILFSAAPITPRERTPDILVRFQALTSEVPCLEARTVFMSSQNTLIEVRRHIQRHFQCLFERGFIFLRQHREVGRSEERAVRLFDIMPHVRLGQPRTAFLFPGVQYKKVWVEKAGRREEVMCVGVVYICEASTETSWVPAALRRQLSGNSVLADSFSFIPAFLTSASQEALDLHVDKLNHLASQGDKSALQAILSELPSNVTAKKMKDHRLATPLHYAAQNGHMEVCEALIGRFGYDILYVKDCNKRTPLHCALHAKKLDVVCYLLHLSPDLEWHDSHGFSCARMLNGLNAPETRQLMLRLEPEVLDPQLVLHLTVFALTSRDLKQAMRYCRYAPVVQAPFYRPPLHLAAEIGHLDIIKALLSEHKQRSSTYRRRFSTMPSGDAGEAANTSFEASTVLETSTPTQTPRSSVQHSPFTFPDRKQSVVTTATAADTGSCGGGELVVKNASLLSRRRKSSMRVKIREPDIVSELDVLLEETVDTRHSPKSRDSDGHLPFHYACQHGHHRAVTLLYFEDMTAPDFLKGVRLALHWNRFDVIRTLSKLRMDYVLDGETLSTIIKESERDICMIGHALLPVLRPHTHHLTRLLPLAAATGAGDVVQMILELKVKPNTADFLGRTPLHEACQRNRVHVVGILLNEAQAEPNVRDWRGSTPLHYACAAGHLEVVEMLMNHKDIIADCADVLGRTPLLITADYNQQQLLSALVKRYLRRLSPMHTDFQGHSILHYASNIPTEVMKELIRGVKDIKDKPESQQVQHFFSPPPYNPAQEAELREIWADPDHFYDLTDDSKKCTRKMFASRQRQIMTISCQRCRKSFTCTQRTTTWSHVCVSQGIPNGVLPPIGTKASAKALVRIPTFLPAGTEESRQDPYIKRQVQTLPVSRQQCKSVPCELSPLDVAVMCRKTEVIAELIQVFPEMAKQHSTAVLAARKASWEALKIMNKSSFFSKDKLNHLLHVATVQNRLRDRPSSHRLLKCARVLLKMGANPNHIPCPLDFKADQLSSSEQSLVPFMALEVAAILDDLELADILLENGASVSICFAVHLAALKGNMGMLSRLLPLWKEGRWKPYVKGVDGDTNELVRVCTLEFGLVQALCASEKVSMELVKGILEDEKDLLLGKKLLTHHMVQVIRPHICRLTQPTLMNKFLYKNAEDLMENDQICQHLPLANLLRCPERVARHKQVETMAVFLIQQGSHLGEIRVSRKSQVHVACELFVLGVKRRMWRLVELLLIEVGIDIWLCLLAPSHTCHKYVYRRWVDGRFVKRQRSNEWTDQQSGFLCLSKGMLRIFRLLPLNLLRLFLNRGRQAMKKSATEGVRAILMPRDDGLKSSRSSRRKSSVPNAWLPPENANPALLAGATPRKSLMASATEGSPRKLSTFQRDHLKARETSLSPTPEASSPRRNSRKRSTSPSPHRDTSPSGKGDDRDSSTSPNRTASVSSQNRDLSQNQSHSTSTKCKDTTPSQTVSSSPIADLEVTAPIPDVNEACATQDVKGTALIAKPGTRKHSTTSSSRKPSSSAVPTADPIPSPSEPATQPQSSLSPPIAITDTTPSSRRASVASFNNPKQDDDPSTPKSNLLFATPRASVLSLRPDGQGAASRRPSTVSTLMVPGGISVNRKPRLSNAFLPGGAEKDIPAQLMLRLLWHHVKQADGTRGHLMVLSKLTLLCPALLVVTLPVLRFHLARFTWLPHVPRQALASVLKKRNSTVRRVIPTLMTDMLEVGLWMKLSNLPMHQVRAVEEQGLTLLHLGCLLGDTKLVKALLTVIVFPVSPDGRSRSGLTPLELAASQGSARMMDVLVKRGARTPRSVLVAACVGRAYTGLHPDAKDKTSLPDETTKLYIVQWCAKNLKENVDLAYNHPKHGTVFDIILRNKHWSILEWLLTNTEVAPVSKLLVRCKDMAELASAPEPLITKFLKSLGEVLLALPDRIMQQFFLTLTSRTDDILERVMKRLMALDYFFSYERLLGLVTARGPHKETIMHNMCRSGQLASLKLFLRLFCVKITKNTQISDFLDVVDSSGCTPLWYCLALKRWTMAEYLITSGTRVSPKRAVPDICVQRSFPQAKSGAGAGGPIIGVGEMESIKSSRPVSSRHVTFDSSQMVQVLCPVDGSVPQRH